MKKEEYTGAFNEVFEEIGIKNTPVYHPKNNCSIGQGYKCFLLMLLIAVFGILSIFLIFCVLIFAPKLDETNLAYPFALMCIVFIESALIFLVCFINFRIARKIYKKCIFKKYSNSTVYLTDENWKCPCCSYHNVSSIKCERCGLSPHLVDNEIEHLADLNEDEE